MSFLTRKREARTVERGADILRTEQAADRLEAVADRMERLARALEEELRGDGEGDQNSSAG